MNKTFFRPNNFSAYEAISEAQKIAYAPLVFQAVRVMRDLGVLEHLDQNSEHGISAGKIAENLGISLYGVETLLESGLSSGVVEKHDDDELYVLSKVGYFLLHDEMTRINMDYNHYICYLGMYYLEEAIKSGKPAGLRVFGENWNTLYEALPHLPDQIKNSWYAFDHYYSDSAYPAALPIILESNPHTLLDIGTNIGKFSILAAQQDPHLKITMVDLPDQLDNAIAKVNQAGLEERISALALDLLDDTSMLPGNMDIYWLSQFLSCFGKDEIISILKKIVEVMDDNAKVYVMETCWDLQQHEPAAFALINTSLYFTAIASGNSKMYHSRELIDCFNRAGLELANTTQNLGICSTLFECRKSS